MSNPSAIAICCLVAAASGAAHGQASFQLLGSLPGGTGSSAAAISADGRVVVGVAEVGPGPQAPFHAFRWTAESGIVGLGALPDGRLTRAVAVSADGSVIAGNASGAPNGAWRWTESGGYQTLQTISNAPAASYAISADGRYISGVVGSSTGRAVRWDETGAFQELNPAGTSARATGISADGTRVGGTTLDNGQSAFRWTQATGYGVVGNIPGDLPNLYLETGGMSGDGNFIVGHGDNEPANRIQAFRWSQEAGFQLLQMASSLESHALAASFDGSAIVGTLGSRAMYWTEATGGVDLKNLLIANGATGLDNWTLINCTGISADGRVVVGTATNGPLVTQGFVAVIPAPGAAGVLAVGLCATFRRRRRLV